MFSIPPFTPVFPLKNQNLVLDLEFFGTRTRRHPLVDAGYGQRLAHHRVDHLGGCGGVGGPGGVGRGALLQRLKFKGHQRSHSGLVVPCWAWMKKSTIRAICPCIISRPVTTWHPLR